jgi:hypothetical protein
MQRTRFSLERAAALTVAVSLSLPLLVSSTTRPASAVAWGDNCTTKPGSDRWSIKTRADSWKGASTAITAIAASSLIMAKPIANLPAHKKDYDAKYLPDPVRLSEVAGDGSTSVVSLHEGDIVSTEAFLQAAYCKSDDSDFHIQISAHSNDAAKCAIVELPSAAHVRPNLKPAVAKVRGALENRLFAGDPPNGAVQPVHVRVTGQLFFDLHHYSAKQGADPGGGRGKKPCAAQTIWEIHPIITMEFLN